MIRRWLIVLPVALALVGGCGGGKKANDTENASSAAKASQPAPSAEETPFGARIEAAGFQIVRTRPMPAVRPGWHGTAVVYRRGDSGGVLWASRGPAGTERALWNWYFDDAAPDSIVPVELNDDGLWDARIHLGSRAREYVHGRDFALGEGAKAAPLALPSNAPDGAWRVLDGDTASTWAAGRSGELTLAAPLGAEAGEIAVHVAPSKSPVRVSVSAGETSTETTIPAGKSVGRVELNEVAPSPDARVQVRVESDADVVVEEIDLP